MNGIKGEIAPKVSTKRTKSFFIGEDGTPNSRFYILLLIIIASIVFINYFVRIFHA